VLQKISAHAKAPYWAHRAFGNQSTTKKNFSDLWGLTSSDVHAADLWIGRKNQIKQSVLVTALYADTPYPPS
jgi:hypothetical protein